MTKINVVDGLTGRVYGSVDATAAQPQDYQIAGATGYPIPATREQGVLFLAEDLLNEDDLSSMGIAPTQTAAICHQPLRIEII